MQHAISVGLVPPFVEPEAPPTDPEVRSAFAREAAIDSQAERLRLDPLALRVHGGPTSAAPTRALLACYDAGAERVGWSRRAPGLRGRRSGTFFLGTGVATAWRDARPTGAIFTAVRVDPSIGELRVDQLVGAFVRDPAIPARIVQGELLDVMLRGLAMTRPGPARALPQLDVLLVNDAPSAAPEAAIDPTAVAAAIANAVHHAIGTRLRHLPIRVEQLLG